MHSYSLRRLSWAGPIATCMATVANLIYYGVTKALGEQYLMPQTEIGDRLGPMPIILPITATLFVGFVATVFFGSLIHFARKPATVFLSVAITALMLSFGGSFSLPAAPLQTKLLLSGMNVITAVFISGGILLLTRKNTKVP
jgi:hypothetical protein